MSTQHTKKVAEILQTIRYATIATVTPDGQPWNTPVAHILDQDLTIYWASDKNNQHSKNIRSSPVAYAVIYDSTVPEGEGEGVYIQAEAVEISSPEEVLHIRKLLKGESHVARDNEFLGDDVRRMYKLTPQHMWINDAEVQDGVFVRDFKVEVAIADVQALLGGTKI